MARSVAVYTAMANPAVDAPAYYVSKHEAAIRCAQHGYRMAVGSTRALLMPCTQLERAAAASAGSFRNVWQQRASAGFLVWQMRSQRRAAV